MSLVKSSTHDCYEYYELKSDEKLFSCGGCKMEGLGPRYTCNLCGHELHKECRFPQNTITHEYFAGSSFSFRKEPFTGLDKKNRKEYSRYCDACGKDICGFSYHSEGDKLDLHPCCRNLQKTLPIEGTVFNLEAKVSSKCKWCKTRKISRRKRDGPGWSYVSTCNNYHFHVCCMTEMVHQAFIKNGDMALDKVDLRHLVKSKKTRGRGSILSEMIKDFLKIILAVLLGDPTMMISSVFMELVMHGFQL